MSPKATYMKFGVLTITEKEKAPRVSEDSTAQGQTVAIIVPISIILSVYILP